MFSKTCQYAMRAVLYLAAFTNEKHKLRVEDLAEALGVPRPFLAKILQQLVRNQLISSIKGPNGGFYLTEEDRKGNLADVVICIDGPDVFQSCISGLSACSSANPCPLHFQAYTLREGIHFHIRNQTIAQIAQQLSNNEFKI
ncbi:MAG: Rrf2 family transcriptional regulator [Saprospiraceae bacterium]|nr:Rrf2 family transcriptional regulator [Saprospiraceae bacterium]